MFRFANHVVLSEEQESELAGKGEWGLKLVIDYRLTLRTNTSCNRNRYHIRMGAKQPVKAGAEWPFSLCLFCYMPSVAGYN